MAHAQLHTSYPQRSYSDPKLRISSVYDTRVKIASYRPGIDCEANETDFEEDISDCEDEPPRRSEDSAKGSAGTLSTVDELETPHSGSNDFSGFNFQFQPLISPTRSVEGPVGPHLFRMSTESSKNEELYLSMSPIHSPLEERREVRRASDPTAHHSARNSQVSERPAPPRTSVPLRTWNPRQVADWMFDVGFDKNIVETFYINDISGVTLIDLKYEDLKELGIASFGQRHRLWNEIKALKETRLDTSGEEDLIFSPQTPRFPPPHIASVYVEEPEECSPNGSSEEERAQQARRRRARPISDVVSPADSASIVAIEQLLPKPHSCSKGENCSKWKKQQRKFQRIAAEFPVELAMIQDNHRDSNATATGPAANNSSSPVESGLGSQLAPPSVFAPSLIASSDVLGHSQPAFKLHEDSLRTFKTRDPQERVRQFLDFQHLNEKPSPETVAPSYELVPPAAKQSSNLPHGNLRLLPKLTIPSDSPTAQNGPADDLTAIPSGMNLVASPLTAVKSGNMPQDIWRMGTPASEMDVPVTQMPPNPIERDFSSSVPPDMQYGNNMRRNSNGNSPVRNNGHYSMSQQQHAVWQQQFALQQFYQQQQAQQMPQQFYVQRSNSNSNAPSRSSSQRRGSRTSSFVGTAVQPTVFEDPHRERMAETAISPRTEFSDGDITPTTATGSNPMSSVDAQSSNTSQGTPADVTNKQRLCAYPGYNHAGWMKKRKTKLLRHEWSDGHFRLRGTQLAMHSGAALDDSALEYIDVDDYAVAIASNGSNSKLNAAIKKLHIGNQVQGAGGKDPAAFAFQLTPAAKKAGSDGASTPDSQEKKNNVRDGKLKKEAAVGKTHHFAVRTATERIDWMRELMLARARREKGGEIRSFQ